MSTSHSSDFAPMDFVQEIAENPESKQDIKNFISLALRNRERMLSVVNLQTNSRYDAPDMQTAAAMYLACLQCLPGKFLIEVTGTMERVPTGLLAMKVTLSN